jgi:hypothetical protein
MRASRQWRYLQSLKRAGFAHGTEKAQDAGDLVLFCPSCPQPGVNVSLEEMGISPTPYEESIYLISFISKKFSETSIGHLLLRTETSN